MSGFNIIGIAQCIALVWLGATAAPAQQTASLRPILELEKSMYAADESVRFWVGVSSASRIPEVLRTSCVLHWARPDGTRVDDEVSWPTDGDPSRGWNGGLGFGKHPVTLGRYVISLECAGQRTPNQSFEIIANPFSSSIVAQWVFTDTKSGGSIHARGAILHVENQTGRVLRFAKPGLNDSEVWLQVNTPQPPSFESTLVSQSALLETEEIPAFFLERLDWRNQSTWPMVIVPPGESADRPVDPQSAYPFRDEQQYEVTIGTVLTVFVGEPDDSGAQLFPMRIPVSATARW